MKNLKQEKENTPIDMTKDETLRTYFYPQKQIELNLPSTLLVKSDGSHIIGLLNGQIINVPNEWQAFSAVTFAKDFVFNISKENNEFESWYDLQGIEKSRTYVFDNMEYTILNPKKVYIKKSGSHYLTDDSGLIHYIKNTFKTVTSVR